MITLDTPGFWAAANDLDPLHSAAQTALDEDTGVLIAPIVIPPEVAWITAARTRSSVLASRELLVFLRDLQTGKIMADCGEQDFGRISALLRRYADLGLDLVDAAVVACAERHGGRVLTTDRRHFPAVARGERAIVALPA